MHADQAILIVLARHILEAKHEAGVVLEVNRLYNHLERFVPSWSIPIKRAAPLLFVAHYFKIRTLGVQI